MFLAPREIRFARGRFLLMGSAVALITVLLVMLTGLTSGLARQNTSAVEELGADLIVFGDAEADPSYTESTILDDQLEQWRAAEGVAAADPLGITQTRMEADSTTSVALFGLEEDSPLAPQGATSAPQEGETVISEEISETVGASVGDAISAGGTELRIAAVVPTQWYSHTPVAWVPMEDWHAISHGADPDTAGTVLGVTGQEDAQMDAAAADADAGTTSMTPRDSFSALASYSSENGSLTLMQAMLYLISALVIAAFLTVWTVQRTRDIAVLKALGASTGYVLRDALTQAALVLLAGAGAGALVGWAGGLAARGAAPVELSVLTTAAPAVGVVLIGLGAAVLAVRKVARVDPLLALGGS